MKRLKHSVKSLPRSRQFALAGSILALLAVLMPWHTIGTSALNTDHTFSGFGDQNLIIGLTTFVFMLCSLLIVGLPMLGARLPRLNWKDSSLFLFLGGESTLLVLVLTIMHATSFVRSSNYDLRIGIYLALIGSASVFLSGYLLRTEEHSSSEARREPFVRPPRQPQHMHDASHLDLSSRRSEGGRDDPEKIKEDARMKLDI